MTFKDIRRKFNVTFDHSERHDVDMAIVSSAFGILFILHILDTQYGDAPFFVQQSENFAQILVSSLNNRFIGQNNK